MLKIKVIRDTGDVEKPEPIVNHYCTELAAALELGRMQIDLGSNPSPITQKVVFTGEASVGWVCESYDRLNGAAWRGMITGVQHGMDASGKLITQIKMLRGE